MSHKFRMYHHLKNMALFALLALVLAACEGDTRRTGPGPAVTAVSMDATTPRFATGPINTACLRNSRRQASRERCGCVQAAADLTLSKTQQQRGVRYFVEPDRLQQVRQSDSGADEAFWQAWQTFAATAEKLCTAQ